MNCPKCTTPITTEPVTRVYETYICENCGCEHEISRGDLIAYIDKLLAASNASNWVAFWHERGYDINFAMKGVEHAYKDNII